VYINFIHGYGGDGILTHTALYSAPPPNTRLTYDTVWFFFEGGKDTEGGGITPPLPFLINNFPLLSFHIQVWLKRKKKETYIV
jgi:hypothetical protein